MKKLSLLVLLISAVSAPLRSVQSVAAENGDPRAEIVGKSAVEMVVHAAATKLAIEDADVGPGCLSIVSDAEILNTEIAPVFRLIERVRPQLLLDPVENILGTLRQVPGVIQPDGKPLARGVYDGIKKRYLARFGKAGVGPAIASRFQTSIHNRRKILQDIQVSLGSSSVRMRGDQFCNSALIIGTYAAISNLGAKRKASDARAFSAVNFDELLEKNIRRPFYALRDAANLEISNDGEKARNARLVERILDEIASIKNGNPDTEAFFIKEWNRARDAFGGDDYAGSVYLAVMAETIIEIHSERLNWIISYPIYAKNGLDWSKLDPAK